MAISFGQSGSLTTLQSLLHDHGIYEYTTLEQIDAFVRTYETKKSEISVKTTKKVEQEIDTLQSEIDSSRIVLNDNFNIKREELQNKIDDLLGKEERFVNHVFRNRLDNFLIEVRLFVTRSRIRLLKRNSLKKIYKYIKRLNKKVFLLEIEHKRLINNKTEIIDKRIATETQELNHIKTLLDNNRTLITGAFGENLVQTELEKLFDDYVVINDFKLPFDPPLYINKTNEIVHKVQIDHLVISRAGLFLIETKNWSQNSVESLDLRSPVDQIIRYGRALYLITQDGIMNKRIYLDKHHWGNKKIPIRNLIVMTNHKPFGEFEYVKILLLRDLIGYIKYFKNVLHTEEFESIKKYFLELSHNR